MGKRFQVMRDGEAGFSIKLNSAVIHKLGVSLDHMASLRFGLQRCEVRVIASGEISEQELVMTDDVIEALRLPLYPEYDILCVNNEFHIGPIIGIAAGKSMNKLEENIHKLSRYVKQYPKIGGAIIAFSNEGIDFEKKLIAGYLYNPARNQWEKGVYPFPLAIFKRNSLEKGLQSHLESLIGKRIFNSASFDKWEMYTWFKNSAEWKHYLPKTKIFQSIMDVEEMLEQYNAVYIKPIKGMQGTGVAKIEKDSSRISIQYIQGDLTENYCFKDLYSAKGFLEQNFGQEKFIVQQPLNLTFHGSIIDFRVIMVKDQTGLWKNYGIVGRNGLKGHIVSNRHRGGKVERADITLGHMFEDHNKITDLLEKMEKLAIMAAGTIENCGFHFGRLGIDVGIDIDGAVWLIEINHRNPNDFVASFSGDKQLVNRIRLANMLYAKRLAGF